MCVDQRHFHEVGERLLLFFRQIGTEVRNHSVVAGQDAVLACDRVDFAASHVSNLHFSRGTRDTCVLHAYDGAVQPYSDRAAVLIQFAVVGFRGDQVFHRRSGKGFRNEGAHQRPCDGGVAIGEVEDVRFFFFGSG